jgi:hypothetical protein
MRLLEKDLSWVLEYTRVHAKGSRLFAPQAGGFSIGGNSKSEQRVLTNDLLRDTI